MPLTLPFVVPLSRDSPFYICTKEIRDINQGKRITYRKLSDPTAAYSIQLRRKEMKFGIDITIAMNFAVSNAPHNLSRYRNDGANARRDSSSCDSVVSYSVS
jgi:hypothetical protein